MLKSMIYFVAGVAATVLVACSGAVFISLSWAAADITAWEEAARFFLFAGSLMVGLMCALSGYDG